MMLEFDHLLHLKDFTNLTLMLGQAAVMICKTERNGHEITQQELSEGKLKDLLIADDYSVSAEVITYFIVPHCLIHLRMGT